MSTKHTFTHADGTVSKRVSQNRVYPFAVEVTVDHHRQADHYEREVLPGMERRLAEIDEAIAHDLIEVRTERKFYGLNHTVYVGGLYAGSWTTEQTHGRPDDAALDSAEAAAALRVKQVELVESQRKEIAELRAGVQHSYGIVSWSSRRDLAQKEADRLNNRLHLYRRHSVVETTYTTKGA